MSKKKILVIDDEVDLLKQLKKRLEAHAFECATATSGHEALVRARKMKFNLILLDLMLPDISGFGVLRELKREPESSRIPVVVLTALGDEEVAREAMAMGAAGYLTKGCSPKELMSMIQEYVV